MKVIIGTLALIFSMLVQAVTLEESGAISLVEVSKIEVRYQLAAQSAIDYLENKGEKPSEFYLDKPYVEGNELLLPLWHITGFSEQHVIGNPGGKNRNLLYDPNTDKILGEQYWQ